MGSGQYASSPPQPLFIANRANPTNFTAITGGDDLDGLLNIGDQFVARRNSSNSAARSPDGINWTDVFSLGGGYPPNRVVFAWQSLFFVYGYWVPLSVRNEISGLQGLNVPSGFQYRFNPIRHVFYDGQDLMVIGDNDCYVSTDYSQTWTHATFTSVRGFAKSQWLLLADCVGTETIIYRLITPTNEVAEVQESALRLNVGLSQTIEIFPSTPNQPYQIECSKDLKDWHLYGIPTTNYPFSINHETFSSDSMFFRTKKLHP
jgi:hypothetical protein